MGMKIPLMKMPEDVEISNELTEDENPKVVMKKHFGCFAKERRGWCSFSMKRRTKNKKVNMKVRRAEGYEK